jgi:hypothetical protein
LSLRSFCDWLASTPGSIALHESFYMYPLVEATHVLTLCLFAGMTLMIDLRLLGVALRQVPASEFTRRIIPLMLIGFAIMATTGLLLFYAIPVRTYHSVFFRFKMLALLAAGVNALVFHTRVKRRIGEWDLAPVPPRAARIAGGVSLACWALIIVAGRMIAYNWFDCDLQPQSAFINWAAGCLVEP